jgi:hypothetical protein
VGERLGGVGGEVQPEPIDSVGGEGRLGGSVYTVEERDGPDTGSSVTVRAGVCHVGLKMSEVLSSHAQ